MAKMITWGMAYWPIFLIVTAVGFLVPELIALVTNTANTLSDYSWRELGLSINFRHPGNVMHNAAWILTLGAWLTASFFLTAHIWFQRFR